MLTAKELPPAPIGIHGGILIDVLRNFVTKMEAKEAEYAGVPNKYSKLCEANDRAYHTLRDEILACYKSVDENQGDANLRNLDCDRIIRETFESVFGSIETPVAAVANSSRDENHIPAQPDPAANKTHPFSSPMKTQAGGTKTTAKMTYKEREV